MSDLGEKTCPLCTEEMDLTDQQLKPCKCGYEICVWCWHHIMEMAEKVETEGRCPACRAPYDKEKIVGMAANCERLIAEINSERKSKSQKVRPKTSEGRKHLSSVRVIQRNLVYIIGIPSNLADEDLLQRKEYFGQYGKVLKVSIARTAGGAIQHTANNTCSVYITYSKEEEANRCIQSVHGFTLEGKPLRACFGTTKYCHAWLRNMPCSNPDCLYLHDIGTQEDSFTKDEIISAFTRSRVQQIAGAANNLQRRSGNILPPPCDDFCTSSCASSANPIPKPVTIIPISQAKLSPPNGSSGRSVALPAAASWGLRVANGRPPTSGSSCLNVPAKLKPDDYNGSLTPVAASSTQGVMRHTDVGKKSLVNDECQVLHSNGRIGASESSQQGNVAGTNVFDVSGEGVSNVATVDVNLSIHLGGQSTYSDNDTGDALLTTSNSLELDRQSFKSVLDKDGSVALNGTIHRMCSALSSTDLDDHGGVGSALKIDDSISSLHSIRAPGDQSATQKYCFEHVDESSPLPTSRKATMMSDGFSAPEESHEWSVESPVQVLPDASAEIDDSFRAFDEGRLKGTDDRTADTWFSSTNNVFCTMDGRITDSKIDSICRPYASSNSMLSNGHELDNGYSSTGFLNTFGSPNMDSNLERGKFLGRFNETDTDKAASVDIGESSIISNILSLDLDVWDDSLTSPHNLAKLLGETDKQNSSLKMSSSIRVQNSNQSRFSFARQEDFGNQHSDMEPAFSSVGFMSKFSGSHDNFVNRDPLFEGLQNGFSSSTLEESDPFLGSHYSISSNKLPVSRSQISAPPGFSGPSRAPPPGFPSQERIDHAFESSSGNHLLESSLLRNQYSVQPSSGFGSAADIELVDPAILAVGKGRLPNGINNSSFDLRSTFTSQLSSPENDPRLQMLMQQSISAQQTLRYPEHLMDRFSSPSDAFGIPSRHLDQSQFNNMSPFGQYSLQSRNAHMPNGHLDNRNEVLSGNDLMSEILRKERLGFNNHFPSYEDLKFRMPGSGDIYNRAYGM
ncbi:hypothetical protein Sjap_001634 [Stephania japonica]|uniref:CCR4-NOT transcription complex subunit 4 n=1 Tax=Stephania japonica TaxID=461633 RepID=A0AAP0KML8_9MAGN